MKLRNKKTGEILEDVKYIDTSLTTIEIHYLDNGVLRIKTEKDYHSFLQNWEDYAPKEPLIKDDKIRKAVRAWAEANNAERVAIQNSYCLSAEEDADRDIVFASPIFKDLSHNVSYTITELCGEEEK